MTSPTCREPRTRPTLVLEQFKATGQLPAVETVESLDGLMSGAGRNDYLAMLAYLPDTPDVREALSLLRCRLTEKYGIPTTAGFGPRYLSLHRPTAQRRPQHGNFSAVHRRPPGGTADTRLLLFPLAPWPMPSPPGTCKPCGLWAGARTGYIWDRNRRAGIRKLAAQL